MYSYLKNETLRMDVYVNPFIANKPQDKISTTNQIVAHKLGHGSDPFEEYVDQSDGFQGPGDFWGDCGV